MKVGTERSIDRFESKQNQILDAATVVLNERGVRGMTFQEISQAISLKTSSITYYYRYKELLAAAVFEDSLARLAAMVREASAESSPRKRVARYIDLYFTQTARSLLGEARPFALLSEIRSLDEDRRGPLILQYQALFREVREFFGPCTTDERRRVQTARTHLLNEALFWSDVWLPRYTIRDFESVRHRMFDILSGGIPIGQSQWADQPLADIEPLDAPSPRTTLLRIATRLINQFGYKGASIDRIMSEMKLTKGSFYHHVDAKDDLVLECFRESHRRLARIQDQIDRGGGTRWHRLAAAIGSVLALQFASDYPLLRVTALQAMPPSVRALAIDLSGREALWLSGVLFEGMKEGSVRLVDPAIASHIIMSSINSAYDIRGWAANQSVAGAVDSYAGLLRDGIFDR